MTIRRGMSGDTVGEIQQRLLDLKLLRGRVDEGFGGGTEAAVKSFQKSENLKPTGAVDSETWSRLFPGRPAPVAALAFRPLINRCLALTGSFETGRQPPDCFSGLSGDYDGQGISFGVLQWNLGQGTLQELISDVFDQHESVCRDIFHEHYDTIQELGTAHREEQLDFGRSIQTRGVIHEPWRGMLKALGRTPEFQDVQVQHANKKFETALRLCSQFELESERAAALMFDVVTQNGNIGQVVRAQIFADYATIGHGSSPDLEVARMRSVANRRAAAAKPQYVDDVRRRKLTIAEGTGTVHGIFYDLEDMFGITLNRAGA